MRVKEAYYEWLEEVLAIPMNELLKMSLTEIDSRLAILEKEMEKAVNEVNNQAYESGARGFDVDVDENGPFIIKLESGVS